MIIDDEASPFDCSFEGRSKQIDDDDDGGSSGDAEFEDKEEGEVGEVRGEVAAAEAEMIFLLSITSLFFPTNKTTSLNID